LPQAVAVRVFDLDDVGSEVAEKRRDHGAGVDRGGVDDAYSLKRRRLGGSCIKHLIKLERT
jgi:hypothetical protein